MLAIGRSIDALAFVCLACCRLRRRDGHWAIANTDLLLDWLSKASMFVLIALSDTEESTPFVAARAATSRFDGEQELSRS